MSGALQRTILALLALVASTAGAATANAAAAPGPLRLTVAFTADVGGYLEPCG